jgi:site-specific DNA recombinase
MGTTAVTRTGREMETAAARVGIYLRISDDKNGTQEATSRQREDLGKNAARQGFELVEYEDVDLSASQRKVRRPQFERLLEDVRDGTIKGILTWRIDRLCRQPRDYVRLEDALEDSGAFLVATDEGIDTRDAVGRKLIWHRVLQAKEEAENISIRTRRAHEQIAKEGRYSGGGFRPFGYTLSMEIIPEEAALIREAARRVLAGQSIRSICIDWEKREVMSSAGKHWQESPLRRLLMKPILAGKREHKGVIYAGSWKAILSQEKSAKLQHLLGDKARRTTYTHARSHLLSGFLICGRCGARLICRATVDKKRRYVCVKQPGMNGCNGLARLADPVEDVVTEMVAWALDGQKMKKYLERQGKEADSALVDSIKADERQLEEFAKDYANQRISRIEWLAARDTVQVRLEQARKTLGKRAGTRVLKEIYAGFSVREQWEQRPLDWKRAVIATMIDKIIIHPSPVRGSRTFEPELIEPIWRF